MAKKIVPVLTSDYSGEGLDKLKQAVQKLLSERKKYQLRRGDRVTYEGIEELLGGDSEAKRQVEAWFLGPRGENEDLFSSLIVEALEDHVRWRQDFHPEDPAAITDSDKQDAGYIEAVNTIRTEFDKLLGDLKKSAPFFSMRYQGHMTWDQTLPGMAGYFAAMLYNQNNVALEASPITTVLEVEACDDICWMLGYRKTNLSETDPAPWGHLTCGGSTANIEALWGARNLKFYPLCLRQALRDFKPEVALDIEVTLPSGTKAKLNDLDTWQVLNLPVDEVLGLFNRLQDEYQIDPDELNAKVSEYSLQNLGFIKFANLFLKDSDVNEPVIFVPGSKHYSLPKGAAILGIGANNMQSIPLDIYGRLDIAKLEAAIDAAIEAKQPILAVVAVIGSTEEGNVDALKEILDLRDGKYHSQDIEFAVHADAAWGGYFASLIREASEDPGLRTLSAPAPVLPMSDFVTAQYENLYRADTITVDPHKTGYLPYPAGALCYRNIAMRSLIAFEAPYINSDPDAKPELILGTYGIEGSKPGAAAAGVYMSHAAIRPTKEGYGKILGRSIYNCKMLHLRLLQVNEQEEDFMVEPAPIIPYEGPFAECKSQAEAIALLRQKVANQGHKAILQDSDPEFLELLRQTGSDLNILTYAFNYKVNGQWNQNLKEVNAFNKLIYDRVGIKADVADISVYTVIVSTTDFIKKTYGEVFFDDYKQRLLRLESPVSDPEDQAITVLRSVVMDPWITEDLNGQPFVNTVVEELCKVVREVVQQVQEDPSLVQSQP
ncbi:pyridoxal phosphate-dependent decarboxylase family protein [Anabaena azotica]|uniref:Decarboxylase n=1 Tax=Anabaena azotica FACHB-119 TaxID=947527 RepID=A0ABR8D3D4_9NOST|nr:pyridoxal-dependent decarboxylase [Anabaena azotica]MBD2501229.1 decarboxylase [Anabaena azotica FACHB-119]